MELTDEDEANLSKLAAVARAILAFLESERLRECDALLKTKELGTLNYWLENYRTRLIEGGAVPEALVEEPGIAEAKVTIDPARPITGRIAAVAEILPELDGNRFSFQKKAWEQFQEWQTNATPGFDKSLAFLLASLYDEMLNGKELERERAAIELLLGDLETVRDETLKIGLAHARLPTQLKNKFENLASKEFDPGRLVVSKIIRNRWVCSRDGQEVVSARYDVKEEY